MSPLYLHIDDMLIPEACLFKLALVLLDVPLALVVLAHQEFVELLRFSVFEKFDAANVMGVRHVLVEATDGVAAVLGLDVLAEDIDVSASFSDEGVSSSLEDQTYAEVWVVFFLLETSLYQPSLEGDVALLLHTEFVTHDIQEVNLTDNQLFLVQHVPL